MFLKNLSSQSGELTQDELSHLVLGERPLTHDVNRDFLHYY